MVALSSSATKIYVCGTKITGTTSFNVTDENGNVGTVSYDNNSRTLTISNVKYTKTGSSNNGISVDEVSGSLTINLVGTVKFDIKDADAVLCKDSNKNPVYFNVNGEAYFYCRSYSHASLKLQGCNVFLQGNGTLHITHLTGRWGVRGGTGSENITFQIKKCYVDAMDHRLYNLGKVTINPTGNFGSDDYSTYIRFYDNDNVDNGYAPAANVSSWSAGSGVKIFKPFEYYGYIINNLTSTVFSKEVIVTDITPVAVFNSTYFPDANFRNYLLGLYSKGYITTSDVNSRTSMSPSSKYILTLQGIGYFNKLTYLDCSSNGISQLDLSSLTSLKTLNASSNTLTSVSLPSSLETLNLSNNKKFTTFNMCNKSALKSVDLSGCTGVKTLSLYNNTAMTSLNVQNCSALTSLQCYNDKLSSLNFSGCSALTTLDCHSNQLTSIKNMTTYMQSLNCSDNKLSDSFYLIYCNALTTLNISNNPNLTKLYCYNNALTSLNVSGCSSLNTLSCYNNSLTSLNVASCSSLTTLNCDNNQLTSLGTLPTSLQTLDCHSNKFSGTFDLSNRSALKSLDISSNPNLTTLNCYSNALTSLNVTNCSAMTTLDCRGNQLTSLDLSGCTALNNLYCYSNKLSSLNISGCSALTVLSCQINQLTSLTNLPTSLQTIYCNDNKLSGTFDVSGRSALKTLDIKTNPNLSELKCNNCSLTSLSVVNCSAMTTLQCYNNQLTSLDVSNLSNLTELKCYNNKITSLNVSNKTKLTELRCNYNELTSLNVQGCSALTYLGCGANKLSSLSVQGCNSLTGLNCCLNQIKESGANTLVNSLRTIPAGSQGALEFVAPGYTNNGVAEANVITDAQVRAARNKRWLPKKFVNSSWVEIPVSTAVPGDVNGDGEVTAADVTALYDYLLNNDTSHIVNGDQTGDGEITSADVTAVYTVLLEQ